MRRTSLDLLLGTLFCVFAGLALSAVASERPRAPHPPAPTREVEARSTPPLAVASYDIDAKLDAGQHRISAKETIHFLNDSERPLTELWFHLYLNAFKNDKTLFLRSPFGAGRSGDKAREYGYIDVKSLQLVEAQNQDLWPNAERHSPGDPDDETDVRVPLPPLRGSA